MKPEKETESTENKGHIYKPLRTSYPNRLLRALDQILYDPKATNDEKLQAAKLMMDTLPLRKTPRRKTDKEKLVESVLKKSTLEDKKD